MNTQNRFSRLSDQPTNYCRSQTRRSHMKEVTFSSRLSRLLTDTLAAGEDTCGKSSSERERPKVQRGRPERREFFYYTQLIDNDTLETVGHLADISTGGFKLDSQNPIPVNKDFRFLMNLTSAVAYKSFMKFVARSRWCKVDPLDPCTYNVGFQLIHISPEDLEIFIRIMEKYGRESDNRNY